MSQDILLPVSVMKKGTEGVIAHIAACDAFGQLDGMVGCRLADLGFSEGMPLLVVANGLWNKGPYAVRLNHVSQFSLAIWKRARFCVK